MQEQEVSLRRIFTGRPRQLTRQCGCGSVGTARKDDVLQTATTGYSRKVHTVDKVILKCRLTYFTTVSVCATVILFVTVQ